MSDRCWISFGADLEPLASDSRRMATPPGPRADGLLVAGNLDEVAGALAAACASKTGWCSLERVCDDGTTDTIHVHARQVRFVGAAPG